MFLLYSRLLPDISISTDLKYKISDVLIRIEQLFDTMHCDVFHNLRVFWKTHILT
jgi:hypothetical protein